MQVLNRITIDEFNNKQELDKWLKEQFDSIPNSELLKGFKWFLMKIEEDVKNNTYNQTHVDSLDKYSMKMIERKLMSIENITKFIRQACGCL
jgi:hypothetical protein